MTFNHPDPATPALIPGATLPLPFAFYGRVSTEDRQDPQASHDWQYDVAMGLIAPHGGVIVEEFFDVGVSRGRPWKRRDKASELLVAVQNPHRGWADLVVGEPQRAFMGSQYAQVLPILTHYGVKLWLPNLGGPFDPANSGHDILMAITGTMSTAERQVTIKRVKDTMASIASRGTGRHLGGRPPYGYALVDAGEHPTLHDARTGSGSTGSNPTR